MRILRIIVLLIAAKRWPHCRKEVRNISVGKEARRFPSIIILNAKLLPSFSRIQSIDIRHVHNKRCII